MVNQVQLPSGRQTLCMIPQKFNKKLWVRSGGFVVVEEDESAAGDAKITGTICQVCMISSHANAHERCVRTRKRARDYQCHEKGPDAFCRAGVSHSPPFLIAGLVRRADIGAQKASWGLVSPGEGGGA